MNQDLKASFMQYDNKLTIMSYNEDNPFGVIMEDELISKSFELIIGLWNFILGLVMKFARFSISGPAG